MWLKDWLERRSDLSHENLLRKLEMFLPLHCKVYLRMLLSALGESLEIFTPFIQKEYMIMVGCCAILQMRSYTAKHVCTICGAQIIS